MSNPSHDIMHLERRLAFLDPEFPERYRKLKELGRKHGIWEEMDAILRDRKTPVDMQTGSYGHMVQQWKQVALDAELGRDELWDEALAAAGDAVLRALEYANVVISVGDRECAEAGSKSLLGSSIRSEINKLRKA